jgi:hypothetical protein
MAGLWRLQPIEEFPQRHAHVHEPIVGRHFITLSHPAAVGTYCLIRKWESAIAVRAVAPGFIGKASSPSRTDSTEAVL